jgi:hypothetical protein
MGFEQTRARMILKLIVGSLLQGVMLYLLIRADTNNNIVDADPNTTTTSPPLWPSDDDDDDDSNSPFSKLSKSSFATLVMGLVS